MRRLALAFLLPLAASSLAAATFTVSNTNDSGAGSLRQAILDANANPGDDTIAFNITGSGVQTIALSSSLAFASATGGLTVDGTTQPGYAGTPLIAVVCANTAVSGVRVYLRRRDDPGPLHRRLRDRHRRGHRRGPGPTDHRQVVVHRRRARRDDLRPEQRRHLALPRHVHDWRSASRSQHHLGQHELWDLHRVLHRWHDPEQLHRHRRHRHDRGPEQHRHPPAGRVGNNRSADRRTGRREPDFRKHGQRGPGRGCHRRDDPVEFHRHRSERDRGAR